MIESSIAVATLHSDADAEDNSEDELDSADASGSEDLMAAFDQAAEESQSAHGVPSRSSSAGMAQSELASLSKQLAQTQLKRNATSAGVLSQTAQRRRRIDAAIDKASNEMTMDNSSEFSNTIAVTGATRTIAKRKRNTLTTTDTWRHRPILAPLHPPSPKRETPVPMGRSSGNMGTAPFDNSRSHEHKPRIAGPPGMTTETQMIWRAAPDALGAAGPAEHDADTPNLSETEEKPPAPASKKHSGDPEATKGTLASKKHANDMSEEKKTCGVAGSAKSARLLDPTSQLCLNTD
ncbi:unnamed protein product [Phytophthora fragariaefolia]|uniref:Unnamed protein product n=1 Tax=Phytophthora fragariaefolia TaxID=1490495 RepID=A0A9W6XQK5_9STRA|nr:unnamed protein product [Phytophthora fragariaefolia]